MEEYIDVDQYIASIISFLDQKFNRVYDRDAVTRDLKEYIYDQAGKISDDENLQINQSVKIYELFTPQLMNKRLPGH